MNKINEKNVFEVWDLIQDSLFKLFKDNAAKNEEHYHNKIVVCDAKLNHYAAEYFTWLRETHKIYNFYYDNLDELNKYAEEHILDPLWGEEARYFIKELFNL